jgi:hypothetical protein
MARYQGLCLGTFGKLRRELYPGGRGVYSEVRFGMSAALLLGSRELNLNSKIINRNCFHNLLSEGTLHKVTLKRTPQKFPNFHFYQSRSYCEIAVTLVKTNFC